MRIAALLFVVVLGVVVASIANMTPARQSSACCDTIYAVSNDRLWRFDSATPGDVTQVAFLTGLQPGESVWAIDFRPSTGVLYGIGGTGRLYTIDTATAFATQVGDPFVLGDPTEASMDFNPVADRIRVASEADENFRLNPDTGVKTPDTNLAYDAADVNSAINPGVRAIGYSNNFAGAASTTLYGIDDDLDILVRQGSVDGVPVSPNAGTLFTIGPLGVNPTLGRVGLDITANNTAFALLEIGGPPQLYTINLANGASDLVAEIDVPFLIRDIAVQPPQPNPTPKPSPAANAFGNMNCTGGINSVDALLVLRDNAGLPVSQTEPCEDIGDELLPNGELQGDIDCSNAVNSIDALKILRYSAGLSVGQTEPCPNIGT